MDINKSLSELAESNSEGRLRLFACECCRRLIPQFQDLGLEELIRFGEDRSLEAINQETLMALRNRFGRVYDSLYPGFGDPSPNALALSAAGEVSFTDSALDAAINAMEFSAQATGNC